MPYAWAQEIRRQRDLRTSRGATSNHHRRGKPLSCFGKTGAGAHGIRNCTTGFGACRFLAVRQPSAARFAGALQAPGRGARWLRFAKISRRRKLCNSQDLDHVCSGRSAPVALANRARSGIGSRRCLLAAPSWRRRSRPASMTAADPAGPAAPTGSTVATGSFASTESITSFGSKMSADGSRWQFLRRADEFASRVSVRCMSICRAEENAPPRTRLT